MGAIKNIKFITKMGIWRKGIRFFRNMGFSRRLNPKKIDPIITSKVILIVVTVFFKNKMTNKKGKNEVK